MTYYYQYCDDHFVCGEKDGRSLIDSKVHGGFEVRGTAEADSWLHAKKLFGFELTLLQRQLLEAS